MRGTLFGIGTGPGDPELLTLKAVRAIQGCAVIAVPGHDRGEKTALAIVEPYISGKQLLECNFAMERDIGQRQAARAEAAAAIIEVLDRGSDVGFITLGDPTTYSTYMYIHAIVVEAGFPACIIPGVTSFAAAAAALGLALCSGDEPLTIIPARHSQDIESLLGYPGNKVIMKSSQNLIPVLASLKQRGLGDKTRIASRVGLDGQQLFFSIAEFEAAPETGYFTVAIVKEND
jgi:precorrin-2/cobalt-factor-2 C20-methyltransferase